MYLYRHHAICSIELVVDIIAIRIHQYLIELDTIWDMKMRQEWWGINISRDIMKI